MFRTRQDQVIDNYHGVQVADPFRWLEDLQSEETRKWARAHNQAARSFLDSIPQRSEIKRRLLELMNFSRIGTPRKEAGQYFFFRYEGLQNQPVLCRLSDLDSEIEVVLDPNTLSDDGSVAVFSYAVSPNGKLLAYACTRGGSDWLEIRVRDLDSGKDYDEVLHYAKLTTLQWMPDSSGFFYLRFPEPGSVEPEDQNYYCRICYHRVGSSQSEDKVVYFNPERRERVSFCLSHDGQYLILHTYEAFYVANRIYYRRTDADGQFIPLITDSDAVYRFVGSNGTTFYFKTNNNANNGRIVAVNINQPDRQHWREIVPEQQDTLDYAVVAGRHLIAAYLHDASHRLHVYSLSGEQVREIELPTQGTVVGLSGSADDAEIFISFVSYLYPHTVFRCNLKDGTLNALVQPELAFDSKKYETRQVFVTSKDGTRVPLFLTHRRGIQLNGTNPVLLEGYGNFGRSMSPGFWAPRLWWLEQGGIYAFACLRGGSEYGESWHRAGMLENKQNTFDDFIAAAEWLIDSNYTSADRLAIMGGSGGGLLVAACMVQRPELYGAVVCRVPVTDMLRHHKLGVNHSAEYGNAEENPDHFRFLYAYSPLHNVRLGAVYPPILITTAENDTRVSPAQAMKFAATLQEVAVSNNPVLLRVEKKAGHGHSKPVSKIIEEEADIFAFLYQALDLKGCGR